MNKIIVYYMAEFLVIVNAFGLSAAMSYKPRLIYGNYTIRFCFDAKNPFALYNLPSFWEWYKLLGSSFDK